MLQNACAGMCGHGALKCMVQHVQPSADVEHEWRAASSAAHSAQALKVAECALRERRTS